MKTIHIHSKFYGISTICIVHIPGDAGWDMERPTTKLSPRILSYSLLDISFSLLYRVTPLHSFKLVIFPGPSAQHGWWWWFSSFSDV